MRFAFGMVSLVHSNIRCQSHDHYDNVAQSRLQSQHFAMTKELANWTIFSSSVVGCQLRYILITVFEAIALGLVVKHVQALHNHYIDLYWRPPGRNCVLRFLLERSFKAA